MNTSGISYLLQVDASNFAIGSVLDPIDWLPLTYEDVTNTSGSMTNSQGKDQDGYATKGLATTGSDIDRVDLTGDFGYLRLNGEVGGIIFDDVDTDGTYTDGTDIGIDGVAITLYQDTNENGVLDIGTDTIVGAQDSGTTGTTGEYLFEKLDPRATYFATVDDTDPELLGHFGTTSVGHTIGTNLNEDNNSQESDTVADGGYTMILEATPTTSDRQDYTGDFGYTGSGRIGDTTYIDMNYNGVYDAGDVPLEGVTIELFQDDGNGIQDINDVSVGTQVTNASGNYLFENLDPASGYWVMVKESNPLYPYI